MKCIEIIAPADVGAVLADVLHVLAEHVRRDPVLQRKLIAVLAPVVRIKEANTPPPRSPWFRG